MSRFDKQAGFSFTEVMIASSLASVLLAGILTTYLQASKSLCAVSNYADIHADGRKAVDWFARDMRSVYAINTFSVSNLEVQIPTNFSVSGVVTGTKVVRYTYRNGGMYRYDLAAAQTVMLATNIYQVTYTLYDRLCATTSLINVAKSIQIDIKLRKYVRNQEQSEDFLSARYDMRNKP